MPTSGVDPHWRMSVIRGHGPPSIGVSLDPSSQLILWQIGVLGHWTYRRSGYDLRSLPILLHKLLERIHPPTIVVYEAPIFPGCAPTITRITLAQLASVPLSGASTLYLPPARTANPGLPCSLLYNDQLLTGLVQPMVEPFGDYLSNPYLNFFLSIDSSFRRQKI